MVVFASIGAYLAALLAAALATAYLYAQWVFQHWRRRGVFQVPPSFPFGNVPSALNRSDTFAVTLRRLYAATRAAGERQLGMYIFATTVLMPVDPDLVKAVLVKDFAAFADRGTFATDKDPLSGHLFNLTGERWRRLRAQLSPTFTSGKMRMMFATLVECTAALEARVAREAGGPVDVKEALGCFTTDVIGSCAFGLECRTFEDAESPFRVYGKRVFERSRLRSLLVSVAVNFPRVSRALGFRLTRPDVRAFFVDLVRRTTRYREESGVRRDDFFQLLLDLRQSDASMTMDMVTAQCFIFFLAGFETSSTAMTFALYELARNEDVQRRLRAEVVAVLARHGGRITYDAVAEMRYLAMVVDETLRKYPPLGFLNRIALKEYAVPGTTDLVLPKGQRVIVSVLGMHYDDEFYPDPERFEPERFSDEGKRSRPACTYLPFGKGPRNCIGLRFGLMQTKVGLISLLRKFHFTINSKTEEPLRMKPEQIILSAVGEVWLDVKLL